MKKWTKYKLLSVIGLLCLAGGGVYLSRDTPLNYQTVNVERRDLMQSVLAIGQLDAIRKVDVGARASGQLEKLYVKLGQRVKKGDLLALIDPKSAQNSIRQWEAELEGQRASQIKAQAELKLAELMLSRQRSLLRSQAVSQQDFDKTQTDVVVQKAELAAIAASLNKNQASLDEAKLELTYTRILAPMEGEVVEITTLEGQTVIAAQEAPKILTLADLSSMLVKVKVPEADVIRLHPGQKAWFTILGDPNRRFSGVIKEIQPTPEKINDAFFYYANMEVVNDQKLLRLNMTAQVNIVLDEIKQALTIPLVALGDKQEDGRYQVAVLKDKKEETRLVTIGTHNNIDVQILSGLNEGDAVIMSRGVPGAKG